MLGSHSHDTVKVKALFLSEGVELVIIGTSISKASNISPNFRNQVCRTIAEFDSLSSNSFSSARFAGVIIVSSLAVRASLLFQNKVVRTSVKHNIEVLSTYLDRSRVVDILVVGKFDVVILQEGEALVEEHLKLVFSVEHDSCGLGNSEGN